MSDAGYYPMGAYSDSNAPYNLSDGYSSKIVEIIDAEIDDLDVYFSEFVGEYYADDYDGKEDWNVYLKRKSNDENVRSSYRDYRYNDVDVDDESDFSDDLYEMHREMDFED